MLGKARWLILGGLVIAVSASALAEDLAGQVSKLVSAYESRSKGVAGVCVADLRTGRRTAEAQADKPCAPASNQKVLTGAFALLELGANYQFSTELHLRGDDLVVVGDFDPTLGDPHIAEEMNTSPYAEMDRWAAAVRRRLGERVAGDLLLRQTRPAGSFRHPDWPEAQHQRWYAAPAASLNFANNCLGVTFEVGSGRAKGHVEPSSYLVEVVDRVKPGRRHLWSLRANKDGSRIELVGTARTSTTDPLYVAVDHPPLLLGRVLADRLRRAGVELGGAVRCVRGEFPDLSDETVLARTLTPLSVVMRRANKRSLNMAAECLFLRAGNGTWEGSAEKMARTLRQAFALEANGAVVRDGSGLSHGNRITPAGMVKVLAGLAKRQDRRVFLDSLPLSGVDGRLEGRLDGSGVTGRVLAKTGYIAGASCLSGYVLDGDDEPAWAFAVLVNRIPPGNAWLAKRLQDDIARALVRATRPAD